jgi:hypothetical protein
MQSCHPTKKRMPGSVDWMSCCAEVCSNHHVTLVKLREQVGALGEDPTDLLQLSARRMFAHRYLLRNRLTESGALSELSLDLGASASPPTITPPMGATETTCLDPTEWHCRISPRPTHTAE